MSLAVVGNPNITRRDIPSKVTGQLVFTYDINPATLGLANDQMLYMGMVRCPYPNAIVKKIDTSAAEAAGYVVLTEADFAEYNLMYVGSGQPHAPISNTVLYPGQVVAAVAAPTTDEVEDAISLIKVEYDVQPFVLDVQDALAPNAPQLFPAGNLPPGAVNPENGMFTAATLRIAWGDADSAIASADVVVGGLNSPIELNTAVIQQAEMEPWCDVAMWSGSLPTVPGPTTPTSPESSTPSAPMGTGLTVYDTTEAPFLGQATLAGYFNIPLNSVRIIGSGIQGVGASGFAGMTMGNKLGNAEHVVITAMMALKSGAAVKYGPTRNDHLAITSQRFSERAYLTFAATSSGMLTAIKGVVYENSGAWAGANGSDTISDILNMYNVANMDISLIPVNTNTHHYSGAFRNVGESQGHFFLERMADMTAQKLNMDPAQFRLMNLHGATVDTQFDPQSGYRYSGYEGYQAFQAAMNQFGWSSLWKGWGKPSSTNGSVYYGVGFSAHNGQKGLPIPGSNVKITVLSNGGVFINSGRTENGAGSDTAIPIMGAESLGLTSLDNFNPAMYPGAGYLHADTALTTNDSIQGGSTSTRSSGISILLACEALKEQWAPVIAAALGVPANTTLIFANNTIYPEGNPSNFKTFTEAAALLTPANGFELGSVTGSGSLLFNTPANTTYRVGGGKFVMVAVDVETAEVRVISAVVGMDIGRVIFAKGAESQVQGGFTQGIGEGLFEEFWNDPTTGRNTNYNFHDFRMATQMDVPDSITPVWVEYVDPVGPFGAKGIGENCSMAVSAAIANAVSNALGNYPFSTTPITKADIVTAIQWMKDKGMLPAQP